MPVQSEDVIDFSRLAHVVIAGWRVILGVLLVCLLAGALYVGWLACPIYTAVASVVLDTREAQIVDLDGMMSGLRGDSDTLNTEVQVLRSRELAGTVVEALDLQADPEFNAALRAPSVFARIKQLVWGKPPPAPPAQIRAMVESALLDRMSVRAVPSSYVIDISVRSESAAKAAQIANEVAQRYIFNQIDLKFRATEQATTWLAQRVSALKSDLARDEAAVKRFTAQTTLVSVEGLQSLEIQLKDIRARIVQSRAAVAAAKAQLARLSSATRIEERRALAEDAELSNLSGDAAAFARRYAQVVTRARQEVARLEGQLGALERSEAQFDAQIARQSDDMIALQELSREAEASRTLYAYFLSRLKETSAQQGIHQADSRILSRAIVPLAPSTPRVGLILGLAAVLGVLAGVALVLIREATARGFWTAQDLEAETGIAVLGQIPVIAGRTRRAVLDYLASHPSSAPMEAIRNLRTSVLMSDAETKPQVILSTSALPEEGKTTNSLGLAMNLAGLGKSVLLIEGDIRRNMLGAYFPDAVGACGLVSVLKGVAEIEDCLIRDPDLGISALMGESAPVNAADLFMSEAFHAFMAQMRARFDYIVIDTPPVLVVPDARIIARHADAVLFSVRWHATGKAQVQQALQLFEAVHRPVTGLILSRIDPRRMRRRGYGAALGGYGAYGANYYE
ncbi:chain-length determining protein [Thioclava dalianensis]|uniref:non-specific protein-tyrosine kinase n=2 Tax=Thioclava dalianensis TaxID=1185766 RepID=A0A074TAJ0_9RHOB|nr:polysaccharide biosynthesis tyrosine autokinase [Thioclava dalianensis]KEP68719.1 chain-length determining protein [Thioclava dalianensis]